MGRTPGLPLRAYHAHGAEEDAVEQFLAPVFPSPRAISSAARHSRFSLSPTRDAARPVACEQGASGAGPRGRGSRPPRPRRRIAAPGRGSRPPGVPRRGEKRVEAAAHSPPAPGDARATGRGWGNSARIAAARRHMARKARVLGMWRAMTMAVQPDPGRAASTRAPDGQRILDDQDLARPSAQHPVQARQAVGGGLVRAGAGSS